MKHYRYLLCLALCLAAVCSQAGVAVLKWTPLADGVIVNGGDAHLRPVMPDGSGGSMLTPGAEDYLSYYGNSMFTVLTGDLDGDGIDEFLIYGTDSLVAGKAYAKDLVPDGVGGWKIDGIQDYLDRWGGTTDTALMGDVDGDGDDEFFLYGSSGQLSVRHFKSDGGGGYEFDTASEDVLGSWGDSTYQPLTGDLDGDGSVEFLLHRISDGQLQSMELISDGGGGYVLDGTNDVMGTWGTGYSPMLLDLDSDGDVEFVIYDKDTGHFASRDLVADDGSMAGSDGSGLMLSTVQDELGYWGAPDWIAMPVEVPVSNTGPRLLTDLDWDTKTDYADFAILAKDWLETNSSSFNNPHVDIDADGDVDTNDLTRLAGGWLGCSDPAHASCTNDWLPSRLAVERWHTWRKSWNTFPIGAWAYFHQLYDGALASYQLYEGANLTMVQAPNEDFPNPVTAGLRPWIGSWQQMHRNSGRLELYKNFQSAIDTNVLGYLLMDEPHYYYELGQLGEATKHLYYYDQRDAIPLVNLNPGAPAEFDIPGDEFVDYDNYVSEYIDIVNPAVLSYDYYPIFEGNIDGARMYHRLELFREKSVEHDIGFMAFALVTDHTAAGNDYREPSESDLNWQVWSYIVYGAKGIWYYNYRNNPTGGYNEGMVTHDGGTGPGTPRTTYYLAQAINADLKVMGPTLLGLRSTGVYHTPHVVGGSIPGGTTLYTNGAISFVSNFTGTDAGDDFILGSFENQDDPADTADYLVVVNRRHGQSQSSAYHNAVPQITAYPADRIYKFEPSTTNWVSYTGLGGTFSPTVGGGQAVLLKFAP